jgi:hypothetical protein
MAKNSKASKELLQKVSPLVDQLVQQATARAQKSQRLLDLLSSDTVGEPPSDKPKVPPEPKTENFKDDEEFLEARDSWRHTYGPVIRMFEASRKRSSGNQK